LSDAVQRGGDRAAEMISVLAGGGFHGPQSWDVALDYLQRAAELGSETARGQLRVLAGETGMAAGSWGALRARVDIGFWTSAPPGRTLSQAPFSRAFAGLLPRAACDWIITRASGRLVRAEVHDPRTGLTIMGQTRTNRVANFNLIETSLLNLLVQARISAATGIPVQMMEAFAVLNYAPGEEASEHFDFLDPEVPAYAEEIAQLGQRTATCLVYLNADYEGGATDFPEIGLSHRGGAGDALVFHSADAAGIPDPRSLHAGRPPLSGEKWVLSQFIRNRPIAPGAPT
jgi:prolyl 4-hydroxylase